MGDAIRDMQFLLEPNPGLSAHYLQGSFANCYIMDQRKGKVEGQLRKSLMGTRVRNNFFITSAWLKYRLKSLGSSP